MATALFTSNHDALRAMPLPPALAGALPTGRPHANLSLVETRDPERVTLERYIHDRFAREYDADINSFMPSLIMLHAGDEIHATLGIRPAGQRTRLFLETYLDMPVEEQLASITQLPIRRDHIVEVGNLAATRPGSSAPLFGALACFLDRAGYEWAVICATPTVQNVFSKLHIPLLRLADADPAALPAEQKHLWGSYYACHPTVMAVHVKTAHRCVRESALGRRLLETLDASINGLLAEWSITHE